jgi:WD40 repeat protein
MLARSATCCSALLSLTTLFLGQSAAQQHSASSGIKRTSQATEASAESRLTRADLFGDPLPAGALARMGSTRFRHAGISDFVFIDGGKTILTSGSDRTLRFRDSVSGKQTRTVELQGKTGPGRHITLSPDGKTLAAQDGASIVLWEVASGQEIKTLPVAGSDIGFLHFSPDGKMLAVGRGDWQVSLWDWRGGKERIFPMPVVSRPVVKCHIDSTFHGSFSPDGKWFVAGAQLNEPLGVFDAATGREVNRLMCRASTSLVSPDSKLIAVLSDENAKGESEAVVRFFELASGKEKAQFRFGDQDPTFRIAFAPDGNSLACSRLDGCYVLDCTSGRVLERILDVPKDMAFSPDGKALVARASCRLRFWHINTREEFHIYQGEFSSPVLAISPDGRFLAAADDWMGQKVSIWEASTGRPVRQLTLGGEKRSVRDLAFSADGRTLVTCQHDGFLQFWDAATGKEQRSARLCDSNKGPAYFYRLCVSPDTQYVATLERMMRPSESSRLAYWEIATGKMLHQHHLPREVRNAVWFDNGTTVALPLEGGASMLDLRTGDVRFRVPGTVKSDPLAASSDGRLLAAGQGLSKTGEVSVCETVTGKEVARIKAERVDYFALAAENRSLVTTDTQFLHVWDLADGKERMRWRLPLRGVDALGNTHVFVLVLSRDGRRAFTPLSDGTCLVWDLTPAFVVGAENQKVDEKALAGCWADLASEDARRAYAAVCRLAEATEHGVALLRSRLNPAVETDGKKVRQLIDDLDSDTFELREKAFKGLKDSEDSATPILREALNRQPSPEVHRRLRMLLSRPPGLVTGPETLRGIRAIQVLEQVATPQARQLLEDLAKGAPAGRLTREAKAALNRITEPRR